MTSPADADRPRMPLPVLRGQKALVTGASSGIGRATAVELGRAGADVVVNYVSGREAAEDAVREVEAFGVRAYAHEADVSREDQVVGMFARMVEEFGTVDIRWPGNAPRGASGSTPWPPAPSALPSTRVPGTPPRPRPSSSG